MVFKLTRNISSRFVLTIIVGILVGLFLAGCGTTLPEITSLLISPTASLTAELLTATEQEIFVSPVVPDTTTPEPPTALPPTATYTATSTQTLEPISTVIATLFYQGTPTPGPTATRTRPPTATPTVTLTPTPPFAYLHITRPGLFSKLISPYRMEAMVQPGEDGLVRIELIGEDNRMIANQVLDYRDYLNRRFWIAPFLEFQIAGAAETARLVMSVEDQFGRKIALSSVDLILMALGDNETSPSVVDLEPYIIRYPYADQTIQGGKLWVSGVARGVNDSPLIIELINEEGNVVGASRVEVPPPTEEMSHMPFGVEIPYFVEGTTPVRLTIRQDSTQRIPGIVALSSIKIVLEP